MQLLGGYYERGILEVRVTGAVDVHDGLLAQLVKVGTVDAVLAYAEQANRFPDPDQQGKAVRWRASERL